MDSTTRSQDRHRVRQHRGGMNNQRLRTSRRAQAGLVALGLASAVGAAGAIGLATGLTSADTQDSGTARPQHSRVATRVVSRDEGDDEGDNGSRPVRQQPAPAPAPQPATGGSTHATTSGS